MDGTQAMGTVDPVSAVERVTGMKWLESGVYEGDYVLDTPQQRIAGIGALAWASPATGWTVWVRAGDGDELVDERGGGCDIVAASRAVLLGVRDGQVILPDGAPGLAALTSEELRALGLR